MATKIELKKLALKLDFPALQEKLISQFRSLDPKDPSKWPPIPRYALFGRAVTAVVLVALWFVWLSSTADELTAEQGKEVRASRGIHQEARPGGQS